MPAVRPIEITIRGKRRWYVGIPRAISDGKQKRRFFARKPDAERFAADVEATRQEFRRGFDVLPIEKRAVVSHILRKVNGDVDELGRAVDFYLLHNPKRTLLVGQLVQEFLADRRRTGLSPKYLQPLESRMRRFALAFATRNADGIKPAEISEWIYSGPGEPATRWSMLKDLRTLFSFAVDSHACSFNIADSVERPKLSRKAPGIFTPDDAERFMRAVERWDRGLSAYVALILFGGLRPEESERCRWEYVKADVIDLPAGKTKNNKRRIIELRDLPTLRAWLDLRGDLPPVNLRKRMLRARAATAIKGDPGRVPPVQWCHDILRHSFVSYAVPIHGIAMTGLMADHSEAVLKKHYRELVPRSAAEKFWQILPVALKSDCPAPAEC